MLKLRQIDYSYSWDIWIWNPLFKELSGKLSYLGTLGNPVELGLGADFPVGGA